MPANDGTRRVWYSIWEPGDVGIEIRHCPLDYNAQAANHAMLDAGLDNAYAKTLLDGTWPSMDVLPDVERNHVGLSLEADTLLFA